MAGKKTKNIGVKATHATIDKRIEEASIWMIENPDAGWKMFMDTFAPRWDLTTQSANNYRKKALIAIGSSASESVESAKRLAHASLTIMLRKAMEQDDTRLAFQIRQEINKVTGAHAPVRTEVITKDDKDIFQISTAEVVKLKKVD